MKDSRFLHEYPYTDFHELNTDWIINEVGKILESIDALSKKIDEVVDKQKELDKKVDDVVKHVDDVKNQVDQKIADVTKHVDDVENKVDGIKTNVDNQDQKITDAQNKATENQTKINNSVKSVIYENDMDISDDNVKLIGRIHVEKPDTGDVATPVYGYVGGGVLGNCVVWSKTPYVGIGEQKDYVMKNPKYATLMEFPINGSFLAICGNAYSVVSAGSLVQGNDLIEENKYLITSDSLVCQWQKTDQSNDTRIMIPKVASGIKFEDARHELRYDSGSGQHPHLEMPFNPDHLYFVYNEYFIAYVVNGTITIVDPDENRNLKIENGNLIFKNPNENNDTVTMLDLGSMV